MPLKLLVIASTLITTVTSSTAHSYQYVKFIKPTTQQKIITPVLESYPKFDASTLQRSFDNFPSHLIDLPDEEWPTDILFPDINVNSNFHHTPDFSNGLNYPDPFLLTGHAAKRAVSHLYNRIGLFFNEIPHVKALLRLQDMRKINGLPANRLGSNRPTSPFYRGIRSILSRNSYYVG